MHQGDVIGLTFEIPQGFVYQAQHQWSSFLQPPQIQKMTGDPIGTTPVVLFLIFSQNGGLSNVFRYLSRHADSMPW